MGDSRTYERTIEDVCQVIHHAKLEEKDLRPLSQTLYFSDGFPEYKLLELDKELYSSLKEGDRVVFRGQKTDKAVLCTREATFDVKEAETSNSMLIIPKLKFADEVKPELSPRIIEEKQIIGVYHEYLEMKRTKPRLLKLKRLLGLKRYRGSELEEEDQEGEGYLRAEDLLERVQASEEELREALLQMGAFCINEKWRLLEDEYHLRCLSYLLGLVESNSWSLNEVPLGEVLTQLGPLLPQPVLHHMVQLYLQPTGQYSDTEEEEYFELKETEVCRFLGICLLKTVEKFNLNDFLKTWQDGVPEGMRTDLAQLGGAAVISLSSRPPSIWYFPEDELPEDLQDRFTALFTTKDKWAFDEIAPYIKRLSTEKQSVNSLLTKYSRSVSMNGTRYYSARHGK